MNILAKLLLILALSIITVEKINAQAFASDDGYVEFVSTAPMLEFKGKSDHLAGLVDLEKNLVDFYIDLNTLDTGINLRNNHMRDSYLETEKYPFAEFTGKIISDYSKLPQEAQEVTVSGIFNIHGVEREMEIKGKLTPDGNGLKLDASWVVLLEDHNIDRPRVVFYELADEQTVNISIKLNPHQN